MNMELIPYHVLLITGVLFFYLATRNIFAFTSIYCLLLLPAVLASPHEVFIIFSIAFFFKGVGALMANGFLKFMPRKEVSDFKEKPFASSFLSSEILNYTIWAGIILSIIAGVYYFKKTGIALFTDEVGYYRLIFRSNTEGGFIFQRMIRAFLPILILIYFIKIRQGKGHKRYVILSGLILINALFLMFTGIRANLIAFMFVPFLIFIGLTFKRIPYKLLVSAGLVALIGVMVMVSAMSEDTGLYSIANIIWLRATLSESALNGINYIVYKVIPEQGLFNGETYLMDIKSLLYKLGLIEDRTYNFSEYVASALTGDRYNNEYSANHLEGELYANWGFWGVVIGGFIAGTILQSLYIKTVRSRKDEVMMPFIAYFHAALISILGGPVVSMAIDYFIALVFFFLLLGFVYAFLSLPTGKIRMSFRRI